MQQNSKSVILLQKEHKEPLTKKKTFSSRVLHTWNNLFKLLLLLFHRLRTFGNFSLSVADTFHFSLSWKRNDTMTQLLSYCSVCLLLLCVLNDGYVLTLKPLQWNVFSVLWSTRPCSSWCNVFDVWMHMKPCVILHRGTSTLTFSFPLFAWWWLTIFFF